MDDIQPWTLPLAIFLPTILVILFGAWSVRAMLNGMKEISAQILAWHGSQESLDAHEKMFRKFLETDFFREKLNTHVMVVLDHAVQPLNLKMDLLDRNVQLATSSLAREMREEMQKLVHEVLFALAKEHPKKET
jgi:hypothetical protein